MQWTPVPASVSPAVQRRKWVSAFVVVSKAAYRAVDPFKLKGRGSWPSSEDENGTSCNLHSGTPASLYSERWTSAPPGKDGGWDDKMQISLRIAFHFTTHQLYISLPHGRHYQRHFYYLQKARMPWTCPGPLGSRAKPGNAPVFDKPIYILPLPLPLSAYSNLKRIRAYISNLQMYFLVFKGGLKQFRSIWFYPLRIYFQ